MMESLRDLLEGELLEGLYVKELCLRGDSGTQNFLLHFFFSAHFVA